MLGAIIFSFSWAWTVGVESASYSALKLASQAFTSCSASFFSLLGVIYNTYESGRTEPPIEIMVCLSHLYNMPIDFIVQKDRTYCTADDVGRQMAEVKAVMPEIDQQITENGPSDPNSDGT